MTFCLHSFGRDVCCHSYLCSSVYNVTFVYWLLLRFYHWLSLVPSSWFCLVLTELFRSVNQIVFKFLCPLPPFWVLNYICIELLDTVLQVTDLLIPFVPPSIFTHCFILDRLDCYVFKLFILFCFIFVVSSMFSIPPYDSFI